MADIAGTVVSFLTLATTWYVNAAVRSTAKATLQDHLRTFSQYQRHIQYAIVPLIPPFNEIEQQHPQVVLQAIRVLQLDASLQRWLFEAGFRPPKKAAAVILVRRRHHASAPSYVVEKRRSRSGPIRLPFFGVTQKEGSFASLFEKLKEAFQRLEDMMYSSNYSSTNAPMLPSAGPYPGRPRIIPMRVAYDSEEESELSEVHREYYNEPEPRYESPPFMMPTFSEGPRRGFQLTRQQKLLQDQALQGLSQQLEYGISDMLRTTGDTKKLRERRRHRQPLEDMHRRVLEEESREEELAADRRRQHQFEHDRQKLHSLQKRRQMREEHKGNHFGLDEWDPRMPPAKKPLYRDQARTEHRFPPPETLFKHETVFKQARPPAGVVPPPPMMRTHDRTTGSRVDYARTELDPELQTRISRSSRRATSPSASQRHSDEEAQRRKVESEKLARERKALAEERQKLAAERRELAAVTERARTERHELEAERLRWRAERPRAAGERRRSQIETTETREQRRARDVPSARDRNNSREDGHRRPRLAP